MMIIKLDNIVLLFLNLSFVIATKYSNHDCVKLLFINVPNLDIAASLDYGGYNGNVDILLHY